MTLPKSGLLDGALSQSLKSGGRAEYPNLHLVQKGTLGKERALDDLRSSEV